MAGLDAGRKRPSHQVAAVSPIWYPPVRNHTSSPPQLQEGRKASRKLSLFAHEIEAVHKHTQTMVDTFVQVPPSQETLLTDNIKAPLAEKQVNIFVRMLNGRTTCIRVNERDKVKQIMSLIEMKQKIHDSSQLYLSRGLQKFDQDTSIGEYKLENDCTIQLCARLRGGLQQVSEFMSERSTEGELLHPFTEYMKVYTEYYWLTRHAKRFIHSLLLTFRDLHLSGYCLKGEFDIKTLFVVDGRVTSPHHVRHVYNPVDGLKDYENIKKFIMENCKPETANKKQGKSMLIEVKDIVDALDALSKLPDIRDAAFQDFLCNIPAIMTSLGRCHLIDWLPGMIEKGEQQERKTLRKICTAVNREKNWLTKILRIFPFNTYSKEERRKKRKGYPCPIMVLMRDFLQHCQPEKKDVTFRSKIIMERRFMILHGKFIMKVVQKLIEDMPHLVEKLSTYMML